MTKTDEFSSVIQDVEAVKAAAVSAVNRVLGILDLIIMKTVNLELGKIGDAVEK